MPARTWKSLLAIGAVAIAAACADDQSPAPTTPGRPSFALNYTGCDFTQVRRDLKNYAVSPKDASYDLVQLLADRYKNNDVAGAKSAAFAIAARVGKIAWTDSVFKTTAGTNAGNSFLKGTFICGGIPLPSVVSFSGALGPNGLLAVRGGPSDPETPVLSRGSPTYGSETVEGTWLSTAGQQFATYGSTTAYGFTNEKPAAPTAYELHTIPDGITFNPAVRTGMCLDLTNAPDPAPKLQHGSVVMKRDVPTFCAGITAIQGPGGSGVLALAKRVLSWVSPRQLYASSAAVLGGAGGLPKGYSPFGAVTVPLDSIVLTITQQPTTGFINVALTPPIVVTAITKKGSPVDGLWVRLVVVGNNGSFHVSGDLEITENGGVATFDNLKTDKAGGYVFVAVGSFDPNFNPNTDPHTPPSAQSLLINVSGQQ